MSYVVDLLNKKKEEYQALLDLVTRQLDDGTVLRSQFEVHHALKAKSLYEEVLDDIDEKLDLIRGEEDNDN